MPRKYDPGFRANALELKDLKHPRFLDLDSMNSKPRDLPLGQDVYPWTRRRLNTIQDNKKIRWERKKILDSKLSSGRRKKRRRRRISNFLLFQCQLVFVLSLFSCWKHTTVNHLCRSFYLFWLQNTFAIGKWWTLFSSTPNTDWCDIMSQNVNHLKNNVIFCHTLLSIP